LMVSSSTTRAQSCLSTCTSPGAYRQAGRLPGLGGSPVA
jgi:hypothetical protein